MTPALLSRFRRLFRRRRGAPAPRFPVDAMRALTREAWRALLDGPLDRALPAIAAAARDGVVEAMLALGQALLDRGDAAGALAWFGAAADAGDAMGINMLARCHELGWGTVRDPARAAALYARAAAMDLDWAQFNLGMLRMRDDKVAAEALFRQAAAQGHAKACNMLGMLAEAAGAPEAAVAWYRAAAAGGDCRGQFNFATVLMQAGHGAAAEAWFRRALAAGNPDVSASVARMRGQGLPVPGAKALPDPRAGACR